MANLSSLFLTRLHETVEKHLENPELDVTILTGLLGMSRTDLHRKITQTAGISTTAYIRKVRLERASSLLRNKPDIYVSSIMHHTGFTNHSYFAKRFKEMFGMCPNTYRKHTTTIL